jgi:hypothetical protein
LRTEAYPIYRQHQYPPQLAEENGGSVNYERNNLLIEEARCVLNNK